MRKVELKVLENAFKIMNCVIDNEKDKEFRIKYVSDAISDLRGYLATAYRFNNLKEKDYDEGMDIIFNYKCEAFEKIKSTGSC